MRRITALMILTLLAGTLAAQKDVSFQVIVNSSRSISSLDKDRLSRLFLKKETRWPDGEKVLPVDQIEANPVRKAFSKEVHKKELEWIRSYWHHMIFSGRAVEPPQLRSDSEVLDFVRANAGAIGYVSVDASIGDEVRKLEIND